MCMLHVQYTLLHAASKMDGAVRCVQQHQLSFAATEAEAGQRILRDEDIIALGLAIQLRSANSLHRTDGLAYSHASSKD